MSVSRGAGPRVLLTGAAGGIGTAAAAALRARGARVCGLDLRADGDDVIACDVTDRASVEAAVAAAAERLGGLDAVVNNAGLGDAQDAGAAPDDAALRLLDVNLVGPWRVTATPPRVVNVASGLAHMAVPFAAAYCMSKRGLAAYSDVLRLEYGDRIAVTTVYPGYIRTPIHDAPARKGVTLEGAVPPEPVEAAGATIARAVLGPVARDLATTRQGAIAYGLLRRVPRRWIDAGVRRRMARLGTVTLAPQEASA